MPIAARDRRPAPALTCRACAGKSGIPVWHSGHSSMKVQASVDGDPNRLDVLWAGGYSIAELWGHSEPVTRSTSLVEAAHGLLWGILSIVEYQVSKGRRPPLPARAPVGRRLDR